MPPNPPNENNQHGQDSQKEKNEVYRRSRVVQRTQFLIAARPFVWNPEIFFVLADFTPLYANTKSIVGFSDRNLLGFPFEQMVCPVWTFLGIDLDKFQFRQVPSQSPTKKPLCQGLSFFPRQIGSGGVFFNEMLEPRDLALGTDVHLKLFLLEWTEPTMLPAPQPHFPAHNVISFFQSQFAFQIGFGAFIVVKNCGVVVSDQSR